ncbi:hypothetical protein H7849_02315 [Alloacidobacterium dinghuense]|uniref:RXYLT1 C-terminal domain-containing protein n=1 Tax=Alloacidobacterium dinghuense TaxID=2763107 RepID=A0A7G8BJY6_9BACT|nr:hypothetical protein [Alloacidobacterium dinghuense]QNI32856.1 hypothetical protein H7849_02315 [Alloacidobacterium dinghuense]
MDQVTSPLASYTAIWQAVNPVEREWIDEIFGPFFRTQITDGKHEMVEDNAILCEAFVYCNDPRYYEQFRGKNAFLVHFLDENFEGRYEEIYRNFRAVFRCHWSNAFNEKFVRKMPIGYSVGMGRGGRHIDRASQRKYLWSFSGQLAKSTRPDMAKALLPLKPYFLSTSDEISDLKFLTGEDYQQKRLTRSDFSNLLLATAFSPCPMGNVQLECFRPYEALEAGSIPIVEKRLTMDYYRDLLGEHPMPTVRSWPEARHFIERMRQHPTEMDALQERCMSWWDGYKQNYREQLIDFIGQRAISAEPVSEPIMKRVYSIPGWRIVELLRHHNLNAVLRRVKKQASRLLRERKLRIAYRPEAK